MARRIPRSWFNGPILVEDPLEPDADGERFGEPRTVKWAYTEDNVKMIRSGTGALIASATQVAVDPEVVIDVGARVTVWLDLPKAPAGRPQKRTSTVLGVRYGERRGLMGHRVLYLE